MNESSLKIRRDTRNTSHLTFYTCVLDGTWSRLFYTPEISTTAKTLIKERETIFIGHCRGEMNIIVFLYWRNFPFLG